MDVVGSLVLFILAITAKLCIDIARHWDDKVTFHGQGALIASIAIVGCSWMAGWSSLPMFLFGWWAIFDTAWGWIVLKKPFYVGTTAKLDILQRKYPWVQVAKYVGFILSIILYVTI